jgi:hypothetical protein
MSTAKILDLAVKDAELFTGGEVEKDRSSIGSGWTAQAERLL